MSHQACEIVAVVCQFKSSNTISYLLTLEYANDEEDCDKHVIKMIHGRSKVYRCDLKKVSQEMMVNQNSCIPLDFKNLDENSADTKVFKQHAKAIVSMVKTAAKPNYLLSNLKLYDKDNAEIYHNYSLLLLFCQLLNLNKCQFVRLQPPKNRQPLTTTTITESMS